MLSSWTATRVKLCPMHFDLLAAIAEGECSWWFVHCFLSVLLELHTDLLLTPLVVSSDRVD